MKMDYHEKIIIVLMLYFMAGGFLARAVSNVNISAAATIIFPSLLAGDIDGNNQVNSLDYGVMNTKWYTNDNLSDLNKDGLVNALDFSLLNKNWQASGD
jgi:hypothetical protein